MKKILMIMLTLWLLPLWAATPVEMLQLKLNAIRTMSADFKQVVRGNHRTLSTSQGKMALSRPGKFRWQTREPMEQLVIADGSKLWIYDVDLEQVTVKKQTKSLGGTAALFLSGTDDTVARDFQVSQQERGKSQEFDLKAKSANASFHQVKMLFVQGVLQSLVLYDQLGQVTEVSFTKVKTNPKLSSQLFQFKPPHGVDVVNQ